MLTCRGRVIDVEPTIDSLDDVADARHTVARRAISRVRTGAMMAVVLTSLTMAAACSSDKPRPLPNTDDEVSSNEPITAEQATSVRDKGRAMALDYVDRLPANDSDIDGEMSTERWADCTAKQKFGFHPTLNGVQYSATVYVNSPPLSVEQVQARFRGTPIQWDADDGQEGTSGVFSVTVNGTRQPIAIKVSSPCYFFADVDGIDPGAKQAVTGFSARRWFE
ncbi:hypothetical protein [Williamsia sp.]|uniref:hypothetical protein n=1 Tax=Williamsia sp. TaxID=1872085 RepID=UPI001A341A2A|nr:hypothetical protein [Williamsia sp.]MBJ7289190.1 hypothetical protein [Williamsia sp.]